MKMAVLLAAVLPAANALVVQNRYWATQVPHLPALFGGALPPAPGIEGLLVFPVPAEDSEGGAAVLGCSPYTLAPVEMMNAHHQGARATPMKRIAMVERGGCTFVEKALNAQAAGADALVVFNNGEQIAFMGASDKATALQVKIPVVEVTNAVGQALFQAGMQTATFVALFDEGGYSPATAVMAYSRHRLGMFFTVGMGLVAISMLIAFTCACAKCVRYCCCSRSANNVRRAQSELVPTQEVVTGVIVKSEDTCTGAPLLNGEPIIIAVPMDNIIQL